jgi:hypothetical protein
MNYGSETGSKDIRRFLGKRKTARMLPPYATALMTVVCVSAARTMSSVVPFSLHFDRTHCLLDSGGRLAQHLLAAAVALAAFT